MSDKEKWIFGTMAVCLFGIGMLYGYRIGIEEVKPLLTACRSNPLFVNGYLLN